MGADVRQAERIAAKLTPLNQRSRAAALDKLLRRGVTEDETLYWCLGATCLRKMIFPAAFQGPGGKRSDDVFYVSRPNDFNYGKPALLSDLTPASVEQFVEYVETKMPVPCDPALYTPIQKED